LIKKIERVGFDLRRFSEHGLYDYTGYIGPTTQENQYQNGTKRDTQTVLTSLYSGTYGVLQDGTILSGPQQACSLPCGLVVVMLLENCS
jgi:hypothetical protein